jgi:nitrite reductase/ring-hydroxylating ferredoxin subunit
MLDNTSAACSQPMTSRHSNALLMKSRECPPPAFALDNRCPHMGFPLERGSVEDGILTCHWHHARFELASGCTFDLWADDVPTCPVEIRAGGEIWVKPVFGYADCRCLRIAEEDRVDMLHDIARNFQEASLVFQRYQRALGPVIHRDLKRLDKRAHGFNVSLDAEVSQNEHRRSRRGLFEG